MPPPAAERGSATVTVSAAAARLLLLIAVIAGAVGGIHRAGSLGLHRPARREQHRRLHPRERPRRLQGGGNQGTASRGPSWPPSAKSRAASAPTTGRPAPAPSARCSSSRRPGRCTETAGTSWTRPTRSPPPPGSSSRTARPATSSRRSSPTTTPLVRHRRPGPGRPLRRRGRPGGLRRRQRRVPAGRPRPAARRHRREDPRRRRSPARQAVRLRGGRAGRLRLLGPGHDGHRAAGITILRTSQAQWAYGTQIPASQVQPGDLVFFAGPTAPRPPPGTSASSSTPPPTR